MGIMRRSAHPRESAIARETFLVRDLDNDGLGRCEAQAFAAPARTVDPYAAWLELREKEQARSRPPIRWVYRDRGVAVKAERGPDGEGKLVGTA